MLFLTYLPLKTLTLVNSNCSYTLYLHPSNSLCIEKNPQPCCVLFKMGTQLCLEIILHFPRQFTLLLFNITIFAFSSFFKPLMISPPPPLSSYSPEDLISYFNEKQKGKEMSILPCLQICQFICSCGQRPAFPPISMNKLLPNSSGLFLILPQLFKEIVPEIFPHSNIIKPTGHFPSYTNVTLIPDML